MNEFKVNRFITLKLIDDKTIIYINEKRFNQCKFLLLDISVEKMTMLGDIESIDEASEKILPKGARCRALIQTVNDEINGIFTEQETLDLS